MMFFTLISRCGGMVDAIDSKSILGCQGAGSSPVIGKLVLLDFDGLLVNTEKLHHLAYQEAFLKWNCPLDINFYSYAALAHHASGTGLKDYLYSIYPSLIGKWDEIRNDKLKIYSRLIETDVELMPYVAEFLFYLEKLKIPSCVVTNSLRKDIEMIKKHLNILEKIPYWITRENYQNPKPAPDGYLTALKLFPKILPSETTGFEDTLKGIESLKAAKINPILICDQGHPQLKDAIGIRHFNSFKSLIS